jgi:hypothetical protein
MNELRCKCLTASSGLKCHNKAINGGYCGKHQKCKTIWNSHQLMQQHEQPQCNCTNAKTGNQCKNKTLDGSLYCGVHKKCKTSFTHRDSPRAAHRDSPRAAHRDSPIAAHRDSPRAAHRDSPRAAHRDSPKAERRESRAPKAERRDVMMSPHLDNLFSPKAERRDVMMSPHLDNLFSPKAERRESRAPKAERRESLSPKAKHHTGLFDKWQNVSPKNPFDAPNDNPESGLLGRSPSAHHKSPKNPIPHTLKHPAAWPMPPPKSDHAEGAGGGFFGNLFNFWKTKKGSSKGGSGKR